MVRRSMSAVTASHTAPSQLQHLTVVTRRKRRKKECKKPFSPGVSQHSYSRYSVQMFEVWVGVAFS